MLMPHGTYVLVVDGGHTRLLRNRGKENAIDLETIEQARCHNARTHVLSGPRPGRSFQSIGVERSAYSTTDTHQRRKDAFCEAALDRAMTAAGTKSDLVLIAPPRVIGVLRRYAEHNHKGRKIREIAQDLTILTPRELSDRLLSYT